MAAESTAFGMHSQPHSVGKLQYRNLEKQPKTDAERARRDAMADRMAETKRRQAEKMQRSRGIRLDD